MSIRKALSVGAIALGLGAIPVAAQANPPSTVVGPGTAILSPLPCTIAAAGHDAAGNAVALTAGHCRVGLDDVFAGVTHIGHFATWAGNWGNIGDDWAIIALDPGVQIGTTTPDGAAIPVLGTNPSFGAMSKFGSVTRTTEGDVTAVDNNVIHATNQAFNGDSGGPAYSNGALVGLVSALDTSPSTLSAGGGSLFSGIDGILADINSHPGSVGSGFSIG